MRSKYPIISVFNTSLVIWLCLFTSLINAQEPNRNLLKNDKLEDSEESITIPPEVCEMNRQALAMLPPETAKYFQEFCENIKKGGDNKIKDLLPIFNNNINNERNSLEKYYQDLETARKTGDISQEIKALSNLGETHKNLRQFNKSLDFYQQVLIVNQKNNDPKIAAETLINIAELYGREAQYDQSIKYLEQSLEITKNNLTSKTLLEVRLNSLNLMGFIYQKQGNYQQAAKFYQQAINIAKNDFIDPMTYGLTTRQLGRLYQSMGDYTQSLNLYQQALAIGKNDNYVKLAVLKSIGDLYEVQQDFSKALDFYEQAKKSTETDELYDYAATLQSDIGRIYNRLGKYVEAENVLLQAVNQGESKYKFNGNDIDNLPNSFLGMLANFTKYLDQFKPSIHEAEKNGYQELQRSLLIQNKNYAALEVSERARSRAFSELLKINLALSGQRDLISQNDNINIEKIRQIAKSQQATLVQYSLLKKPIQNGLLEYGINFPNNQAKEDLQLLIWVIKPNGEITFKSVDLKTIDYGIENLVKNSRSSLVRASSTKKATESNLKKLHQLLIDPIANQLPTNPNDRVVFIPDGALFLVPFVALQDAQGKYLIEKHTISTSPAIKVLELVNQQRKKVSGQGALVVGNPIMPQYADKLGEKPRQLSSLPNAELEAKNIAKFLNTQALIGASATKQAILQQMPKARIIHFATHGLLDYYEGLGSALAFAPSAKDDGFLTAQEIISMQLNAELVVLSACDTGRGVITGDGVIGLSRSFFAAGVPSVIVSLWAVPDAPTSILMTEFYQVLQTQPNKAQALRQAMLNTMKKHPAPQDWAAFTLVGEVF